MISRAFSRSATLPTLYTESQIALAAMQAEVLLKGGTIVTQDRRQARARAVAVSGGRIVASAPGDDDLVDLIGTGTHVIDLNGAAVVPGFVDAHVHFGHWALAQQ